jgi:phage shock protein A
MDRLLGLLSGEPDAAKQENPQQAINRLVRDLKRKVVESRTRVGAAVRDARKLHQDCQRLRVEAERHHQEAKRKLQAGDEGGARRALAQRVQATELGNELEREYQRQREAIEQLKASLEELANKVRALESRRDRLHIRARRARALEARREALEGREIPGAQELLADLSARLEVDEELLAAGSAGDSLERRFAELEASGEHAMGLIEDLRSQVDED